MKTGSCHTHEFTLIDRCRSRNLSFSLSSTRTISRVFDLITPRSTSTYTLPQTDCCSGRALSPMFRALPQELRILPNSMLQKRYHHRASRNQGRLTLHSVLGPRTLRKHSTVKFETTLKHTEGFVCVPRISSRTSKGSLSPVGGAAVLRFVPRVPGSEVVDVFEDIVNEDDRGVG